MKITARSSGGFAGLSQNFTLDTTKMPPVVRQALEQTLQRLGFFDAAADQSPDVIGSDIMRWNITVIDGERNHTISFVQDGSPASAPWNNLLDRIMTAAA